MRILLKTLLISVAVAGWLILTLVLLKTLPIELFPLWPVASFTIFMTGVIKHG